MSFNQWSLVGAVGVEPTTVFFTPIHGLGDAKAGSQVGIPTVDAIYINQFPGHAKGSNLKAWVRLVPRFSGR